MKFWYNPNFISLSLILIFSFFALKSLIFSDFYTSHDGETHTARIAQYYQGLKDGQFPPRYAGSFYNYLESPIFVYIYPLPYILGSAFHLIGFSFTNSFKLLMILGFMLSQVFVYLWLFELFRDRKAAFIGAIFYCWIPYRFLLIYVRGSVSEILAYTFVPLALYFVTRAHHQNKNIFFVLTTIAISAVFLSQNLVALLTIPVISMYAVLLALFNKSIKFLFKYIISVVWALLISSFTYLPSLFERQYVRFDSSFNLAYGEHYVCFRQMIRSPWDYGFDFPGCLKDSMSLSLGLGHLLMLIIFIFVFIYMSYKTKMLSKDLIVAAAFFAILCLSVFIMLDSQPTKFVWKNIKQLQLIDIPWRFTGLFALSSSVLAAFLVKSTKVPLVMIILILAVLVANRNHIRVNKSIQYGDRHFLNYKGTATERSEFTPNFGVSQIPDIEYRVTIISGNASVESLVNNSRKLYFTIKVDSPKAKVRVNKFYFPGVTIYDNNKPVPKSDIMLTISALIYGKKTAEASRGLMTLTLSRGTHQILVHSGETRFRILANIISLTALVAVLAYAVKHAKD